MIIDSLLVDWKLMILSLFPYGSFFWNMPIRPIRVIFFFSIHSHQKYVESNQSNTRDRKKTSQQGQTFFLQCSSLLRASISGLLHRESMGR